MALRYNLSRYDAIPASEIENHVRYIKRYVIYDNVLNRIISQPFEFGGNDYNFFVERMVNENYDVTQEFIAYEKELLDYIDVQNLWLKD